jgi:hypothetical protein
MGVTGDDIDSLRHEDETSRIRRHSKQEELR